MTFNEDDVEREDDGKFGKKTGKKPEVVLPPLTRNTPDTSVDPAEVLADFKAGKPHPLDDGFARKWANGGQLDAAIQAGTLQQELSTLRESGVNKEVWEKGKAEIGARVNANSELIATRGRSDTALVERVALEEQIRNTPGPMNPSTVLSDWEDSTPNPLDQPIKQAWKGGEKYNTERKVGTLTEKLIRIRGGISPQRVGFPWGTSTGDAAKEIKAEREVLWEKLKTDGRSDPDFVVTVAAEWETRLK